MLDEQIKKVLDELIDISKTIETIKAIAEKKDSEILELSRKITDDMHALEINESITDEEAAAIAKRMAQNRRDRRDSKNFVEQVAPLLTFYAKHEDAMLEMKAACEHISGAVKAAEKPLYVQKTEAAPAPSETANGVWKTPKPVLAETRGGICIQFGSVASAARAFGYEYQEIMNCCYGEREDIDGDKFSFITGNIKKKTTDFAIARAQLLDELKNRKEPQGATDTRPAPEITDVRPAKQARTRRSACRVTFPNGSVEDFDSILAAAAHLGTSDGTLHYSLKHGSLYKGHKIERI